MGVIAVAASERRSLIQYQIAKAGWTEHPNVATGI
jgi:hypothetical protein